MADHFRPATGYPATNPSTATAFPHAAPPPPYLTPPPPPPPRATFFRRLIAILLVTFTITGIILLVTWLALRPRLPQFRVDALSLSNLTLSPPNNPSLLSATCDLRFTVRNPNHKLTLYSSPLAASLYYKAEPLSDTTVPPFVLGTRDEASFRATFAAADRYVDGWVVEGINWEKANTGSVSFNVRMVGWVRFKAGAWRPRRRLLRVYCGELPVGVSGKGGGGSLLGGGPRRCVVGL